MNVCLVASEFVKARSMYALTSSGTFTHLISAIVSEHNHPSIFIGDLQQFSSLKAALNSRIRKVCESFGYQNN